MGASTVGKIIAETVRVLWEELEIDHMPVPTEHSFRKIAEDFHRVWNFPPVIGALDGKHIRVQCPKNSGSMFYNYKKFFSVVLQGVADADYRFVTVDIGAYGKQSDGGTFKSSDLYYLLENKIIETPKVNNLPLSNMQAPFVLIGDEAYPLLTYLLRPFSGKNLTDEQDCFNKRLSRARKTVECAFGILYAKWRLLSKSIETDVGLVNDIIKCICILHNTIIDKEGFQRHLTEVSIVSKCEKTGLVTGRPSNAAKTVRDIFVTYFSKYPISYE